MGFHLSFSSALAGADEEVDLGGAEVALVHADEGAAGGDLDAHLVHALTLELGSMPATLNASLTKWRTVLVSPVAATKSSALSC